MIWNGKVFDCVCVVALLFLSFFLSIHFRASSKSVILLSFLLYIFHRVGYFLLVLIYDVDDDGDDGDAIISTWRIPTRNMKQSSNLWNRYNCLIRLALLSPKELIVTYSGLLLFTLSPEENFFSFFVSFLIFLFTPLGWLFSDL